MGKSVVRTASPSTRTQSASSSRAQTPNTWRHQHLKTPNSDIFEIEGGRKKMVQGKAFLHSGAGQIQALLMAKREQEARRRSMVGQGERQPTVIESEKEREWAAREELLAMNHRFQVTSKPSPEEVLEMLRTVQTRPHLLAPEDLPLDPRPDVQRRFGLGTGTRQLYRGAMGGLGTGTRQHYMDSMEDLSRSAPEANDDAAVSRDVSHAKASNVLQIQTSPQSSLDTIQDFFQDDDGSSFVSDARSPKSVRSGIDPWDPASRTLRETGARSKTSSAVSERQRTDPPSSQAEPERQQTPRTSLSRDDLRRRMSNSTTHHSKNEPPGNLPIRPHTSMEASSTSSSLLRQSSGSVPHQYSGSVPHQYSGSVPHQYSGSVPHQLTGSSTKTPTSRRRSSVYRTDSAIKHEFTKSIGKLEKTSNDHLWKGPKKDPEASALHHLEVSKAAERAELDMLIPLMKGARRPPYSIESPYDPEDDEELRAFPFRVDPGTREWGHREQKDDQFAWWSKHWSKILNPELKPPIKPVEKIWMGNFQRSLVPWRKEQLGSFPAYRDFPWPPPEDVDNVQERMGQYFRGLTPYAEDRDRFVGPNEKPINTIMRDEKMLPDFLDRQGDLTGRVTTVPGGKGYRPHSVVGWGGYKNLKAEDKYDLMTKRVFSNDVDRIIGIVSDKLTEHCFSNFYQAFTGFDTDKSGKIDLDELKAFLQTWNIILQPHEVENLFTAFLDPDIVWAPGEKKEIDYTDFVEAIDKSQSTHPLDPLGKDRMFKPMKPALRQLRLSTRNLAVTPDESQSDVSAAGGISAATAPAAAPAAPAVSFARDRFKDPRVVESRRRIVLP